MFGSLSEAHRGHTGFKNPSSPWRCFKSTSVVFLDGREPGQTPGVDKGADQELGVGVGGGYLQTSPQLMPYR